MSYCKLQSQLFLLRNIRKTIEDWIIFIIIKKNVKGWCSNLHFAAVEEDYTDAEEDWQSSSSAAAAVAV